MRTGIKLMVLTVDFSFRLSIYVSRHAPKYGNCQCKGHQAPGAIGTYIADCFSTESDD